MVIVCWLEITDCQVFAPSPPHLSLRAESVGPSDSAVAVLVLTKVMSLGVFTFQMINPAWLQGSSCVWENTAVLSIFV